MKTNLPGKILILALVFLGLSSCNKDVEGVRLEGFVYENKKPLPNFRLFIKNYYYKGGDYDSFMPAEAHTIVTDEDGYYALDLERSAYVQIDTVKEGYSDLFKDKYIYKKKAKVDFHLKRK